MDVTYVCCMYVCMCTYMWWSFQHRCLQHGIRILTTFEVQMKHRCWKLHHIYCTYTYSTYIHTYIHNTVHTYVTYIRCIHILIEFK